MTEKEFRKLRAKDLVQLLLTQGGEASRLQEQIDKKEQELAVLLENNDLLKQKLDDRDEYIENLKKDLDFRDSHIKNLETEMEALRNDLWIDMQEMGTLTDAGKLIDEIFGLTQKEADQHIKFAREQGIDPAKVRIEKPAMPVTVMPTSVPRGSAALSSETRYTAAAAGQTEKENITEFSRKAPKAAKAAGTAAKAPKAAKAAKAAAIEKASPQAPKAAASEPRKKEPSAISRFAAESKAAFESDQAVSAIDRLAQTARTGAKDQSEARPELKVPPQPEAHPQQETAGPASAETPDRLAKAAWAAAAAIGELSSPAKNGMAGAAGMEIPGIDPAAVIPPAAEHSSGTDSLQSTDIRPEQSADSVRPLQTADSTHTESTAGTKDPASAEPGAKSGEHKRHGLFGLFRSGKQKSGKDAERYESSPMVARMKN